MIVLLALVLACESLVLWQGQRRNFGLLAQSTRFFAMVLAVPGTVLHEGAHWLACKLLGVATGRVSLFRPVQHPDGSLTLGSVTHAEVDPLRMALVAVAPLLLVPPLLLGALYLLLGGGILHHPLDAFAQAGIWQQIVSVYVVLSCGAAAFPSPGDHIPLLGAILIAGCTTLLFAALDPPERQALLQALALVLAPASISAALQLVLLRR